MPIVTIYLLGYDLGLSDEAVLDVCPRATARRTGAEIDAGHPFIAGIHHRSHIVQIPRLRGRRRDELERVLSIFDQGAARIDRGGAQVLTIDEAAYPRQYGFVLRQLQRAASESDVRRFMEGEDQLLRDSISWGRQADYERREKERERAAKEISHGHARASRRSPDPSGSFTASGRSRTPSPRRWSSTWTKCAACSPRRMTGRDPRECSRPRGSRRHSGLGRFNRMSLIGPSGGQLDQVTADEETRRRADRRRGAPARPERGAPRATAVGGSCGGANATDLPP